jgi:hypothetical protein
MIAELLVSAMEGLNTVGIRDEVLGEGVRGVDAPFWAFALRGEVLSSAERGPTTWSRSAERTLSPSSI